MRRLRRLGAASAFTSPPSLQEKLSKSLAYILNSQDTVQTQIAELEEAVKHTEVRAEGAPPVPRAVGDGTASLVPSLPWPLRCADLTVLGR